MTAIHPYRMKSEDDLSSMRSPSGPCNRVASKKTVRAENLVRLGAERLAGILLELAGEQPAIKRRLRLELAGEAGGEIIAAEISKRITALRSAQSFIDWQRRPDFVRDLDLTRATIADRVAETRPDLALDLMWRFMALPSRSSTALTTAAARWAMCSVPLARTLALLRRRPSPTRRRSPSTRSPQSRTTTWRVRPPGPGHLPGARRGWRPSAQGPIAGSCRSVPLRTAMIPMPPPCGAQPSRATVVAPRGALSAQTPHPAARGLSPAPRQ